MIELQAYNLTLRAQRENERVSLYVYDLNQEKKTVEPTNHTNSLSH